MMKNKIKEFARKFVKSEANKAAVKNANSACGWWLYHGEPSNIEKYLPLATYWNR